MKRRLNYIGYICNFIITLIVVATILLILREVFPDLFIALKTCVHYCTCVLFNNCS